MESEAAYLRSALARAQTEAAAALELVRQAYASAEEGEAERRAMQASAGGC